MWCNFVELYFMHHWNISLGTWQKSPCPPPPAATQGKILRLDLSVSCNFQQLWISWQKSPPRLPLGPIQGKILRLDLSISCNFKQLWFSCQKSTPQWPNSEKFETGIYPFHAISSNFGSAGRKAPPLIFHERPGSHHTCRIPMVPILQIHTQIPPIWISSIGYQLCKLFKILTYTEVQGHRIMVQVEGL